MSQKQETQPKTKETPAITPKPEKPKLLSDFYKSTYELVFNAIPPEEREILKENLTKPNKINSRGEVMDFDDVRHFIQEVVEKSEADYDAYIAKERKKNEQKKPNPTNPKADQKPV